MELNILQLVTVKQTFDNSVKAELLKMDCFFQDHLWDACSEPTDPKFISDEDFEAIQALTDKMKHMICNIGCPNSVIPMLESICTRKIKRWQAEPFFYGGMDKKGWVKGKQLRSKDELNIVKKSSQYEWKKDGIIVGHFRWNDRGYILSRRCSDLLQDYLVSLEF